MPLELKWLSGLFCGTRMVGPLYTCLWIWVTTGGHDLEWDSSLPQRLTLEGLKAPLRLSVDSTPNSWVTSACISLCQSHATCQVLPGYYLIFPIIPNLIFSSIYRCGNWSSERLTCLPKNGSVDRQINSVEYLNSVSSLKPVCFVFPLGMDQPS